MASRGVTVNVIAPGFIETDMTAGLKEELKAEMLKQIPLGLLRPGGGHRAGGAVSGQPGGALCDGAGVDGGRRNGDVKR